MLNPIRTFTGPVIRLHRWWTTPRRATDGGTYSSGRECVAGLVLGGPFLAAVASLVVTEAACEHVGKRCRNWLYMLGARDTSRARRE